MNETPKNTETDLTVQAGMERQDDFYSERKRNRKKIIREDQTEAIELDKLVDRKKAINKVSNINWEENTEIAERHSDLKEKLHESEEKLLGLTKALDISQRGFEKRFPERLKGLDIRNFLEIVPHEEFIKEHPEEGEGDDKTFTKGIAKTFLQTGHLDEKYMGGGSEGFFKSFTIAHELLHLLSFTEAGGIFSYSGVSQTMRLGGTEKLFIKGEEINEAITRYFAVQVVENGSKKRMYWEKIEVLVKKDDPSYRFMEKLSEKVGDEAIEKMYFDGDKTDILNALRPGSFVRISDILDSSLDEEEKFAEAETYIE